MGDTPLARATRPRPASGVAPGRRRGNVWLQSSSSAVATATSLPLGRARGAEARLRFAKLSRSGPRPDPTIDIRPDIARWDAYLCRAARPSSFESARRDRIISRRALAEGGQALDQFSDSAGRERPASRASTGRTTRLRCADGSNSDFAIRRRCDISAVTKKRG